MRRSKHVIWNEVDDQVVGLDLRTSRYFSLNESARALWLLLDDATAESLCESLVREYHVDEAQAERDVSAFVVSLSEYHLIED